MVAGLSCPALITAQEWEGATGTIQKWSSPCLEKAKGWNTTLYRQQALSSVRRREGGKVKSSQGLVGRVWGTPEGLLAHASCIILMLQMELHSSHHLHTRFELKSDLLCDRDGVQFVDLLWFCRNISMKNSYLLFCEYTIKQHHNQNILWQHGGRVSMRTCPWKGCHVWKAWIYMPPFEFFLTFPFPFIYLFSIEV